MKWFLVLLFTSSVYAQKFTHRPVPQKILLRAKEAVDTLGKEVRKGNFLYSLDNMYPNWKKLAASHTGGEAKLRERLESVPLEMQKKGITIVGFEVMQPTQGFEVRANLYHDRNREPDFTEYLVIVPTKTIFRVIDPNSGTKKLESLGFQIAITNQERTNEWSFIDGGNMQHSELSKLFPLLPTPGKGLILPERALKELK